MHSEPSDDDPNWCSESLRIDTETGASYSGSIEESVKAHGNDGPKRYVLKVAAFMLMELLSEYTETPRAGVITVAVKQDVDLFAFGQRIQ